MTNHGRNNKNFIDDERFLESEIIREAYEDRSLPEMLLRSVFGFFPEDVPSLTTSIIKKIQLDGFEMVLTLEPIGKET